MKDEESGFVLGWVMILGMIFMILLLAALSSASALYRRSVEGCNQKQTYLTASSVLEVVIADLLNAQNDGPICEAVRGNLSQYFPEEEQDGKSAVEDWGRDGDIPDRYDSGDDLLEELPDMKFDLDDSMGSCTVKCVFYPSESVLVLTAAAVKGKSEDRISARLKLEKSGGAAKWNLQSYEASPEKEE